MGEHALSRSVMCVHDALTRGGFAFEAIELPQSTRTAAQAPAAVGCEVTQIVKSLVFGGRRSGTAGLGLRSVMGRRRYAADGVSNSTRARSPMTGGTILTLDAD